MVFQIKPKHKLWATIAISFTFFVVELAVAVKTRSVALLADAFHYMGDLLGFTVTLVALLYSEQSESPQELSFGWQRVKLLGAFFNGVFMLGLGMSIAIQSIERFTSVQHIQNPMLVLVMGSVGLFLNIISILILHEHHDHDHAHANGPDLDHVHSHGHKGEPDYELGQLDSQVSDSERTATEAESDSLHEHHKHLHARLKAPGRDLGMFGALLHVMGDALNNIVVIIAAAIVWKTSSEARFYADPAVGLGIGIMIVVMALPLVKNSGMILLQSTPVGLDLGDVKHDIELIPGIESIHELHVWRLDQRKAIASAHLVVSSDQSISSFMEVAKTAYECLHAYGIHSATLQPELLVQPVAQPRPGSSDQDSSASLRYRRPGMIGCQIPCGNGHCENLRCCASGKT